VNGDGRGSDLLIGGDGAVYLFYAAAGGMGGLASSADTMFPVTDFAYRTAGIGDIDGDGFSDIAVARHGASVDLYRGASGGIPDGSPAAAVSLTGGSQFGTSVAGRGDVNHDGYADLLVGDPSLDVPSTPSTANQGGALLFLGGPAGIGPGSSGTADRVYYGPGYGFGLGQRVASVDLDGDAVGDVLAIGSGQLRLRHGSTHGRSVLARQREPDGPALQRYGRADAGPRIEWTASHPHGSGWVRLEAEACPSGVAFGHPTCVVAPSPSWVEIDPLVANEVGLEVDFDGFFSGSTLHRWRARVSRLPRGAFGADVVQPQSPAHTPWHEPAAFADAIHVLPTTVFPGIPIPAVGLAARALLALGLLAVARLARRGRSAPRGRARGGRD
jgi:hypothetical protein